MNELDNRLDKIEACIDKLEQERIALWEIAREVADVAPIYYENKDGCKYCSYCRNFQTQDQWLMESREFNHEPSCIVLKARALVAQKCSDIV